MLRIRPYEALRLRTLLQYKVLDTPPEPFFDDLARLSAIAARAPIALVAFADGERHWLKVQHGLSLREVSHKSQLLEDTLDDPQGLLVADVQKSAAYLADPLVKGEPAPRFYAGVPIMTAEQVPLGVLAVMDVKPRRRPGKHLIESLTILARHIMIELEHRHRTAVQQAKDYERMRFVADEVDDLVAVLDPQGRRLYNNEAYRDLFGDPELLRGTESFPEIHPDDRQRMQELFRRTVSEGKGERTTFKFVLRNGTVRTMESRGTAILDSTGNTIQVMVVAHDTIKRAKLEEAQERHQAELEQRYREISALNTMANLLHRCDGVAEIKKAFKKHREELFPTGAGAFYLFNPALRQFEEFVAWRLPESRERYFSRDSCWAVKGGSGAHLIEDLDPTEALVCRHVGELKSPYMCVQMAGKGDTSVVLHLQLSSMRGDMSQEERRRWLRAQEVMASAVAKHFALAIDNVGQREELQRAAEEDDLTGLFNKKYMEQFLQREVLRCTRNHGSLGVIMVDVDHFKRINDTYGHQAGDYVLRQVGLFLRDHIRGTDIACRYGGEEFMLIMPDASESGLRKRAEQVRQQFKQLKWDYDSRMKTDFEQDRLQITLSLGIATLVYNEQDTSHFRSATDEVARLARVKVEDLKRAADKALYEAKAGGRDRVVVWRPPDLPSPESPAQAARTVNT